MNDLKVGTVLHDILDEDRPYGIVIESYGELTSMWYRTLDDLFNDSDATWFNNTMVEGRLEEGDIKIVDWIRSPLWKLMNGQ
jgi:hypothetical protein